MKKLYTKILYSGLILTLVANLFIPSFIFAAGISQYVPVAESGGIAKKECGVSILGMCMPKMSLNSIAYMAAKVILEQITSSIVEWINSGFEGSPGFLSDPAGFFTDIIDQEIGSFIESSDLNFLCSPFNIDIRLSLAFKYSPFKKRISCTFTDALRNTTNAVNSASINGVSMRGFMNGDFARNGGWSSWISMTQTPSNNPYGAYLEAETELGIRIANKRLLKTQELGEGKGFLSWKKCKQVPVTRAGSDSSTGEATVVNTSTTKEQCTVETPGSTVSSSLETSLGSGVRQLELADQFDEIVSALMSQLIVKATQGLSGLSGKGPGDQNSYLYGEGQRLNELQRLQEIASSKNSALGYISTWTESENSYKANYDVALGAVNNTLFSLMSTQRCYISKPNLTSSQTQEATRRNTEIQTFIDTNITPELTPLNAKTLTVDTNISTLNTIKAKIVASKDFNTLTPLMKELQDFYDTGRLHTDIEIQNSVVEKTRIVQKMEELKVDVEHRATECRQFPNI
ncbi:MAG: hypothetical protein Q7R78_01300 [bacterium]|nr:hypothetical protein [bacterium]